jgi:glycosyltransferase involved in cell wall biosynthesis
MINITNNTDFFKYSLDKEYFLQTEIIPIYQHFIDKAIYTIAITVYNRVDFLKQCIDSAISQKTETIYSIIVIDDFPQRNNNVEKLMMQYANFPNISYYKKSRNEGLINNMNRCFILSHTKWVISIHDDDWLLPNYIEEVDKFRKKHPDYKCFIPSHETLWFGRFVQTKSYLREKLSSIRYCWRILPTDFINGTCATPTGSLIEREAFLKSGGYNSQYGMAADYVFFAKFSSKEKIMRINKKLFVYRYAENESLKQSTQDEFKIIGHHLCIYLLEHYTSLTKRLIQLYENERIFLDFQGNKENIYRVLGIDIKNKTWKRSSFIYSCINLYYKTKKMIRIL